MEKFSYSNQDEDTILHRLKNSLDHIWSVRKKSINSPKRLEIQMSSSYILKDRSLDYTSPLTVIPELYEEHITQSDASKNCSKFSTKIEFIKPKQRISEDSPTSVKSDSSNHLESPSPDFSAKFEPKVLEEKPKETKNFKPELMKQARQDLIDLKKPIETRKQARQEVIELKKPQESKNFKPELMKQARQEVMELKKSKEKLQTKVENLTTSLGRLREFKQESETVISIESKLQKLEQQQLIPEGDSRLPEAIMKVRHLESEIQKLKRLKDSSVLQYEEELENINLKLKDLQECNEILTEILACFKKEPLLLEKAVEVEPLSPAPKELLNTIKLDELMDSDSAIEEAYVKREQLIQTKEKLEAEYREIPSVSKSLSSKRRKLSLEYELSINYSQLVAINGKLKKLES